MAMELYNKKYKKDKPLFATVYYYIEQDGNRVSMMVNDYKGAEFFDKKIYFSSDEEAGKYAEKCIELSEAKNKKRVIRELF
jgi:hypothetical protein